MNSTKLKKFRERLGSIFSLEFGTGKEKTSFFKNFTLLLNSGVPIAQTLKSLSDDIKSKKVKSSVLKMVEDVENGSPLWKAFENAKLLPEHYTLIVRVGEESGSLKENLDAVIRQQEKGEEFKAKLRSASIYPVFVLVLMTVIGLVIGFFVLPRLTSVYKSLDVKLPLITRMMISLGDFLGSYGQIVLPIFLISFISIIYFVFFYKRTKHIGQSILFHIPVIKRSLLETELTRFGFLMGTLQKQGFSLVDSIGLVNMSTGFFRYNDFYKYLQEGIEGGKTFQELFNGYKNVKKLIPLYVTQMIISGEESGQLIETFLRIGDIFEKKSDQTAKDFAVLLEPILLIVVWIGVSFLALAVVLPTYSLMGSFSDLNSSESAIDSNTINSGYSTDYPESYTEEPMVIESTPETTVNTNLNSEITVVGNITILQSELGYRDVYDGINGNPISKVYPGETYAYVEINGDWIKIQLNDNSLVWIQSNYVTILK